MTAHIPERDWKGALQEFTQRNAGRATTLEEDSHDFGAQDLEEGFPLRGVAYDERDRRVEIMLGDLEGTEHHLTHTVSGVTGVDVLADSAGHDVALRVRREDGQTILRFQGN